MNQTTAAVNQETTGHALTPTGVKPRQSLIEKFAERFHIDAEKLLPILKATAFKVSSGEATNEQMAALLAVADQHKLNPFTREIFAFEDRGRIVPIVSIDGWARIINDQFALDGVEWINGEEIDCPHGGKKAFKWMECVIHRKDREHPTRVREYFDEVYQPPRGTNQTNGPWQSHPKRMHRHKTLIQCARIAFGFAGIYDEDEGQRIIDAQSERVIEHDPKKGATDQLRSALTKKEDAPRPILEIIHELNTHLDRRAAGTWAYFAGMDDKLLHEINAHPDSLERTEALAKWASVFPTPEIGSCSITPGEALAEPKAQPRRPTLDNVMKQLGSSDTIETLEEIMGYVDGFEWNQKQKETIVKAYRTRRGEVEAKADKAE